VCSCSHTAQHRPETVHGLSEFYCIFSCFLPSTKPGLIYIAVVILTWVVQLLRIALSKGPDIVGVSPSAEEGNGSSFQNVVFSSF
jgi:hypothetical protein